MSASPQGFARTLYVEPRLTLANSVRKGGADLPSIERAIEGGLAELEKQVAAARGDIEVRTGKSRGGAVRIFVYRAFRRKDRPSAEAVVAGVTFLDGTSGRHARADVCLEESGTMVLPDVDVELEAETAVQTIVANLAARLARSAEQIIAAVDASPAESA